MKEPHPSVRLPVRSFQQNPVYDFFSKSTQQFFLKCTEIENRKVNFKNLWDANQEIYSYNGPMLKSEHGAPRPSLIEEGFKGRTLKIPLFTILFHDMT